MLYRNMDKTALDAAYNNAAAIGPEKRARYLAGWSTRNAAISRRGDVLTNLRYGDGLRQRIDFFPCGQRGTPTLVFIHGGYWQMASKEDFAFIAEGPLANGINVASIEYTLAPDIRMDGIVAEVRCAVTWLIAHLGKFGAATDGVYLAGHSAGGHLAVMAMSDPGVRGGISISGIFDLEPIQKGSLNDKIRMDAEEARRNSPLLHIPERAPPLIVAVGADELPELRRQSDEFYRAWTQAGLKARHLSVDGRDHLSILDELVNPNGVLSVALNEFIRY